MTWKGGPSLTIGHRWSELGKLSVEQVWERQRDPEAGACFLDWPRFNRCSLCHVGIHVSCESVEISASILQTNMFIGIISENPPNFEAIQHLVIDQYNGEQKPELMLVPQESRQEMWLPLTCFDISPQGKNGCFLNLCMGRMCCFWVLGFSTSAPSTALRI